MFILCIWKVLMDYLKLALMSAGLLPSFDEFVLNVIKIFGANVQLFLCWQVAVLWLASYHSAHGRGHGIVRVCGVQ